jgi:hypothetical protein
MRHLKGHRQSAETDREQQMNEELIAAYQAVMDDLEANGATDAQIYALYSRQQELAEAGN